MPIGLTPGGLTSLPPLTGTASDLVAAVVSQLASTPSTAIAFGGGTGRAKFFSDEAVGSPTLPYLVVTENQITQDPESPAADGSVSYIGTGELVVDVYATTKSQAKSLRDDVIAALTDANLTNQQTNVLYFRQARPVSPPKPGVNVGVPQSYVASVTFAVKTDTTL